MNKWRREYILHSRYINEKKKKKKKQFKRGGREIEEYHPYLTYSHRHAEPM